MSGLVFASISAKTVVKLNNKLSINIMSKIFISYVLHISDGMNQSCSYLNFDINESYNHIKIIIFNLWSFCNNYIKLWAWTQRININVISMILCVEINYLYRNVSTGVGIMFVRVYQSIFFMGFVGRKWAKWG